jgi:hypothetical protein
VMDLGHKAQRRDTRPIGLEADINPANQGG